MFYGFLVLSIDAISSSVSVIEKSIISCSVQILANKPDIVIGYNSITGWVVPRRSLLSTRTLLWT